MSSRRCFASGFLFQRFKKEPRDGGFQTFKQIYSMAYPYILTDALEAGTSGSAHPLPISPYSSLSGALDIGGSLPQSRDSQQCGISGRQRMNTMGGELMWPTNHLLVPQIPFSEERATPKSYPDKKYPPIVFQLVNFPEVGIRISKIVGNSNPRIAGSADKVLDIGDREIKLWLQWPGYDEPLQKRIKTHSGTITRDTLLLVIAKMVLDFTGKVKSSEVPVKPGYESWAIGSCLNSHVGITGPELFITRLIHRGGANWQPELWAPRFN